MLSILNPRSAMQFFTNQISLTRLHFILVANLSLFYLFQGGIFIASIDILPPFPYMGLKKVESLFWTYAFLFALIYAVLQFLTLLVWKIAQWFQGSANLKETRLALSWSLLCANPMGFFLLLLQATFNHPTIAYHYLIDGLAFAGALFFLIYGLIVCLKALSEVHQFSIWRSIIVYLLTFLSLGVGVFVLQYFLRGSWCKN